jgi:hypothetical protein
MKHGGETEHTDREAAAAALEAEISTELKKDLAAEIERKSVVAKYAGNRLPKSPAFPPAPMEIDIGATAKVPVKLVPATGPVAPTGDRGAADLIMQLKTTRDRALAFIIEQIADMHSRLNRLQEQLEKLNEAGKNEDEKLISKIAACVHALDEMDTEIQKIESLGLLEPDDAA